jgi:tRNA G18 (ribose-2'-O)-methylase SpoU
VSVIESLKTEGWKVVALEIVEGAEPINEYNVQGKVCLVVGHEITGVPEDIVKLSDGTVYIPMHGKKESLNVSVAAGIALNHLRNS